MSDRAINKLAGVIVSIAMVLGLGQIAVAQLVDVESGGHCRTVEAQTCGSVRHFDTGAIAQ